MSVRIVFSVLCLGLFLAVIAHSREPKQEIAVRQPSKGTLLIQEAGETPREIDISGRLGDREGIPSIPWPNLRTPSPDGKYIPLYVNGGDDSPDKRTAALLLVNTENGTVQRHELFERFSFFAEEIRWVTSNSLAISAPLSYGNHVFHNIETGKTTILLEEAFPAWDARGENYASVYAKHHLYAGRHGLVRSDDPITTEAIPVSEALRYNSYCVYPVPVKSFRTVEEHAAWGAEIGRMGIDKVPSGPPRILHSGINVMPCRKFSRPVFVGQTTWAAVFEVAYSPGDPPDTRAISAVLVDAHKANQDPPRPEDILVLRTPPLARFPLTSARRTDFILNLEARWNDETSRLELWKRIGWQTDEGEPQKLGEIPVDLKTMEFGEYSQTLPVSEIRWTGFGAPEDPV